MVGDQTPDRDPQTETKRQGRLRFLKMKSSDWLDALTQGIYLPVFLIKHPKYLLWGVLGFVASFSAILAIIIFIPHLLFGRPGTTFSWTDMTTWSRVAADRVRAPFANVLSGWAEDRDPDDYDADSYE